MKQYIYDPCLKLPEINIGIWGDITTKENAEECLSWYGFNQEQINYAINNCSILWQLEDAND